MPRSKLSVATGIPAADVAKAFQAAHRASGMSLYEAGRQLGVIPPGLSEEAWRAECKRRWERDWQQHILSTLRLPRLRWALRRVWPLPKR